MAESKIPQLSFRGTSSEEWATWKESFRKKYIELLGLWPEKASLSPFHEYTKRYHGVEESSWVIQTEVNCLVRVTVLSPIEKPSRGDILCCHGHAYHGRHNSIGCLTLNPFRWMRMIRHHYGFAKKYAQSGFRTTSIDMRGFNERGDGLFPFSFRRDKCNVNHLKSVLFGYNFVTLQLWDHLRTLDFMEETLGAVPGRIGVTGISLGGTIGIYLAALDERISPVAIASSLTTYTEHSVKHANTCGSQFIPGILRYGELADIAGLIAPRPVHFSNGLNDGRGFSASTAENAFRKIKAIYRAAGAEERCSFNSFKGKHSYNFETFLTFFKSQWEER